MKQCRGPCKETRPLTEFRQNSKAKDGRESVCKACRGKTDRAQKLKKNYGITPEFYQLLVHAQHGLCGICSCPPPPGKKLEVDHDHDTGKIRGLLCGKCNRAIGLLDEHPAMLARAIDYVTKHRRDSGA